MKKVLFSEKNIDDIVEDIKLKTVSNVKDSWDKDCIVNKFVNNKFRLYKHTAFVIFPKRSLYCELAERDNKTEVKYHISAIPKFFNDYKPFIILSTMFIAIFLFSSDSFSSIGINFLIGILISIFAILFFALFLICFTFLVGIFSSRKQDKDLINLLYELLDIPKQEDI